MQVPVSLKILTGLHALTRKFVTEILVSSLTTVLVMALFPNMTKPASLFARNDDRLASTGGSPAGGETSETLDDFMERVALSHISGLKTPPVAASQEAIVAVSKPTTDTGTPLPPLAAAARDMSGQVPASCMLLPMFRKFFRRCSHLSRRLSPLSCQHP